MAYSPAFQFYPADYTIGTKFFTPAERGAYVDCLCHQWDEGSIPGDDLRDLAVVMRCTEDEARALWVRVSKKFQRGDDGQWRNERLESEREKQRAHRETQAENGRRSAAAKAAAKAAADAQRNPNRGPTIVVTTVDQSLQPNGNHRSTTVDDSLQPTGNQKSTLQSSSSSSSSLRDHTERTAPAALRPVEKSKPAPWRVACAIAHKAIEAYPDGLADQTDAFKEMCAAQRIDYAAAGGADRRPLYARALDYVAAQRANRGRAS